MKKLFILTLAILLCLSTFAGCNTPQTPNDSNTPESPKDVIDDYDDEEVIDVPADGDLAGGELVVKYKICDYGGNQNVAIVSIENHSEQPLTIRIKGYCEDTLLEKTTSISRTFYGFAAGWQNYFVFPPQVEFDEFWYELEYELYDGNTYGQYLTNLEWQEIALMHLHHEADGRVAMMPLWMYDWVGKESAKYKAHYVMLNSDGEVVYMGITGSSLGGFDPDSGWNRNSIYAAMENDYNANFYDLGFSYNNSFGPRCGYFPASDAYEASGYELPEKYQGTFGIICFTGIWGTDTPAGEQPPSGSLYMSY